MWFTQEQGAGGACDANIQRSRAADASPRRGLVRHRVRLQRQSRPRAETHAHRGAVREHLHRLQGTHTNTPEPDYTPRF